MRGEEEYELGPNTDHSAVLKTFIDVEWHKLDTPDTWQTNTDRGMFLKTFIDLEWHKLYSTDTGGPKPGRIGEI